MLDIAEVLLLRERMRAHCAEGLLARRACNCPFLVRGLSSSGYWLAAWVACGPSLVQTSKYVCFGPSLFVGFENIALCPFLELEGFCIISGCSLMVDVWDTWVGWASGVWELRNPKYQSQQNQRWTALTEISFSPERCSSALTSAEFLGSGHSWYRENQSWSGLKQRWSVLLFFMFSESVGCEIFFGDLIVIKKLLFCFLESTLYNFESCFYSKLRRSNI